MFGQFDLVQYTFLEVKLLYIQIHNQESNPFSCFLNGSSLHVDRVQSLLVAERVQITEVHLRWPMVRQ